MVKAVLPSAEEATGSVLMGSPGLVQALTITLLEMSQLWSNHGDSEGGFGQRKPTPETPPAGLVRESKAELPSFKEDNWWNTERPQVSFKL